MWQLRRWMNRRPVAAVHEEDLEAVLDGLGLGTKLARGELRCGVCRRQIDLDNLRCLYPEGDEVKVCCDNPECYQLVVEGGSADAGHS